MMELVIDRNVPTRLYYILVHVDLVDLRPTTAPTTRARPEGSPNEDEQERGQNQGNDTCEKAKEIGIPK